MAEEPTAVQDFLVLSRGQWDESASPAEVQQAIDGFYAWHGEHMAAGRMRDGSRLGLGGRVVRRGGRSTDGPYAEAKEVIGGYWFVRAASLDEAAAILAGNPCLAYGLSCEIRPLDPTDCRVDSPSAETPQAWRQPGGPAAG